MCMRETELWYSKDKGLHFPELEKEEWESDKLSSLENQCADHRAILSRVRQIRRDDLNGDIVGVVCVPDLYEFELGLTDVQFAKVK